MGVNFQMQPLDAGAIGREIEPGRDHMQRNFTRLRSIDLRGGIGAIVGSACLVASLVVFLSASAAAQPNGQVGHSAWCVDLASLGGYLDCSYHTYEQCAAAARGVSNVCVANSFYAPRPPQRPRRDQRR